jgi:hypothetical protein
MRRGSECGHWRGSKKGAGRVGGRCGREIWQRARVRTRRSTAGARRADLTRRVHGAEREKRGRVWQRLSAWQTGPVRQRERRGARAKKLALIDRPTRQRAREREPAGERAAADRWGAPVRRRGRAAWLGRARLVWDAFSFSFSMDFLIPFLFLFYRIFNPKFKLSFKFK